MTGRSRRYRRGPGSTYRKLESLRFLVTRDRGAVAAFIGDRSSRAAFADRVRMVRHFIHATNHVRGYHTLAEMLTVARAILRLAGRPNLTVVEAGAGLGGSTAKLSLAVAAAGGRLLVFDSFRGIPPNDEVHRNLDGRRVVFRTGAFAGRLAAVRRAVHNFGAPEVCEFHKGWFADTLQGFRTQIDVVLMDVDLLASTRTCLAALYPNLRPGGALFSQDGHLQATVELFEDDAFWAGLGVARPIVPGLGRDKLLVVPPPNLHSSSLRKPAGGSTDVTSSGSKSSSSS